MTREQAIEEELVRYLDCIALAVAEVDLSERQRWVHRAHIHNMARERLLNTVVHHQYRQAGAEAPSANQRQVA